VDTAKFTGDQRKNDGGDADPEALAPVEFAEDLRNNWKKSHRLGFQTGRNSPYRLAGDGNSMLSMAAVQWAGSFRVVRRRPICSRSSMSASWIVKSVWLSTSLTCNGGTSFREDTEPFAQAGLVVLWHFDLQNAADESI